MGYLLVTPVCSSETEPARELIVKPAKQEGIHPHDGLGRAHNESLPQDSPAEPCQLRLDKAPKLWNISLLMTRCKRSMRAPGSILRRPVRAGRADLRNRIAGFVAATPFVRLSRCAKLTATLHQAVLAKEVADLVVERGILAGLEVAMPAARNSQQLVRHARLFKCRM